MTCFTWSCALSTRFSGYLAVFLSQWISHWTVSSSLADKLQPVYINTVNMAHWFKSMTVIISILYTCLHCMERISLSLLVYRNMSYDVSHLPIPSMQNIVSFVYKISCIKHESKIFKSGWWGKGRNLGDRNSIIIYKTRRSCVFPVNMIIS